MLELTIQRGGKKLIRMPVGEEKITIGRARDNSIRLLDEEISRHHCKIERLDGALCMTDLSTNGTFLNGEMKKHSALSSGDRIVIGPWIMQVESPVEAEPAKTVVAASDATRVVEFNSKSSAITAERIEFIVRSPDQATVKKTLSLESISFGHHASCDIRVADPFVSRRHCKIVSRGEHLHLIDLASTNGTYIDDIRISKTILSPRGVFKIGKSTINYRRIQTTEKLKPSENMRLGKMIGGSRSMREVFALIKRVGPSNVIVCITGESGTGKELAARELHDLSLRKRSAFVPINCGAVPGDIIESLLFGHERGSFTGALERSIGLFEQANGGTLFLDEIGEMPLHLQTRLLRVIEDGSVRRIGGKDEISVDVRLICATNKNLRRIVAEGRFREDLFFRLFVVPIHLPPLRERREDIPALANHMMDLLADPERNAILTDGAIRVLSEYSWPGNVRELKNTIMRALVLSDSDVIDEKDIEIIPVERSPDRGVELKDNERSFLLSSLMDNKGNISRTAKALGIARTTLQKKIKNYGIDPGR